MLKRATKSHGFTLYVSAWALYEAFALLELVFAVKSK